MSVNKWLQLINQSIDNKIICTSEDHQLILGNLLAQHIAASNELVGSTNGRNSSKGEVETWLREYITVKYIA